MTKRLYRVTLTQVNRKSVRSIHYVDAGSHNEASQAALLKRLQSDMLEGHFNQWAPIMIQPCPVQGISE